MNAKEYRICLSDTPAQLASEVTDLLAQGWEPYGHPFTSGQNGDHQVCQAMIKLAEERVLAAVRPIPIAATSAAPALIALPKPVPIAPPKPASPPNTVPAPRPAGPRVTPTFRNLAIFLGVILVAAFAGDAIFFRSGFYTRFLDPLGSTGTFERILYAEIHRPPSGKKDVLIIGNSRIAEGFSAKIANEYKQDGYWFANCAVLGSPARAWYYLVRDLDPHRDRYAAITIPIDDYDDPDDTYDPADMLSELSLVVNRLRLTDILPFTLSFKAWPFRFEALRGSIFKGVVMQRDLYAFLEQPSQRLQSAKDYRQNGSSWFYGYGGNERSLAGLSVDWTKRQAIFPPGTPEDAAQEYRRLMFSQAPQTGRTHEYLSRWLGAIADLYRNSKTRIIIYQVPRNPAPSPSPLAHLPVTTVQDLAKRPWVRVVDRHVFEPLEKPELFFDYVHLNTEGRKIFSPMLAETVKEQLR